MMNFEPSFPDDGAASDEGASWPTEARRIATELGRLRDSWAGPETKAPPPPAVEDLEVVVGLLPDDTRLPDIEVDEGDARLIGFQHGVAPGQPALEGQVVAGAELGHRHGVGG